MMWRCWLALLVTTLLLCALLADSLGDGRKGGPDDFPSPDKAVNNTAEHLGEQKAVHDPVKAGDAGNNAGRIRVGSEKENKGVDLQNEKKGEGIETKAKVKDEKGGSGGDSNGNAVNTKDGAGAAHVEECDPSNRCFDDKNKFIACLRVPGNDSPTLSLLIQNKGTGSLTVNILAPDYVSLEDNVVLLQAEEDRMVKVSVEYGVNNTPIVLTARDGHCNLSFWDMIPSSIKTEGYSAPLHVNFFIRSPFIYLALAAFVLFGAAWLWVRFQRMRQLVDPRYQKLDGGLPLSSGGVMENDVASWDNSWGGSWDDEEAPKTPSKALSNLSSKGLAARRSNKDGWKD